MSLTLRQIVFRTSWGERITFYGLRSQNYGQPSGCRCLSNEPPKNDDETKIRTTDQPKEDPNKHSYQRFRGQMVQITAWKKRFLFLSGRWKSINDIPNSLQETKYNSDMWVTRVRIATGFMILWLVSCLFIARWGKKHEKEKAHRIVMEQYMQSLNEEEKKKFMEEFDIERK